MIIYLSFLSLAAQICYSATFSGQFIAYQSYIPLTYLTVTSNNYITFTTTFTPRNSEALLVASTTPITPSANSNDWQHINPKSQTHFDYEGLVTGETQFAWLGHPGSGVTVYFYLVNLQSNSKPFFSVVVSQPLAISRVCSSGSYYGSTFYCSSCSVATLKGVYCQIPHTSVSAGQFKSLIINSNSYYLVTIQSSFFATISTISSSSGVSLYFQSDSITDELAGVVNHILGATYDFTVSDSYLVTLQNLDYFSIGIINNNNVPVTVSVEYLSSENQSYLFIILAAIGGLVVLGIIAILIAVIKRNLDARRQVHPHLIGIMPILRPEIQTLSNHQIQKYFPEIPKQSIFSLSHNNSTVDLSLSEHQCVICLCTIQSAQLIRVGYCRHIFHGRCLLQWFQKQQTCPYCRRNYEKKETLQMYQSLKQENGGQLRGVEIPQAIFRPKHNISLQTLQVEEVEQEFK